MGIALFLVGFAAACVAIFSIFLAIAEQFELPKHVRPEMKLGEGGVGATHRDPLLNPHVLTQEGLVVRKNLIKHYSRFFGGLAVAALCIAIGEYM